VVSFQKLKGVHFIFPSYEYLLQTNSNAGTLTVILSRAKSKLSEVNSIAFNRSSSPRHQIKISARPVWPPPYWLHQLEFLVGERLLITHPPLAVHFFFRRQARTKPPCGQ
jgi:hypothetical protein